MWPGMEAFSFLGRKGKSQTDDTPTTGSPRRSSKSGSFPPSLKVTLDKKAYRPGDMVGATIEISNDMRGPPRTPRDSIAEAVLMEDLLVEVRGIEKLDPQWLITPKVPVGLKQRRGERTILKTTSTLAISNVLIGHGSTRTYSYLTLLRGKRRSDLVRMMLPKVLPPTYRGTAVRYLYYISSVMHWTHAVVENGLGPTSAMIPGFEPVEVRTSLQIWSLPNKSGLTVEESQSQDHYGSSGIVPPSALEVEVQWKEKGDASNWSWASDINARDGVNTSKYDEDPTFHTPSKLGFDGPGYERSLSILSSRPTTPNLDSTLSTPTSSRRDMLSTSMTELTVTPWSSIKRFGTAPDSASAHKRTGSVESSTIDGLHVTVNGYHMNGLDSGYGGREEDDTVPESPHSPAVMNSRGRSYNIRMDNQVLVRFSPKNPTSTYYFGDMVAGTLQFFHEEGPRKCLEVSAVLETREVLNVAAVHPSRKNSTTITKVQSEYYDVVCDMYNTHFLFSVPFDGPISFSTPLLSVQWVLRFEFVASPPDIDWSKIEHPLLTDLSERRKGEWSMPLTVHATVPKKPPPGAIKPMNERVDTWARSPRSIYKTTFNSYPDQGGDAASTSGSSPNL